MLIEVECEVEPVAVNVYGIESYAVFTTFEYLHVADYGDESALEVFTILKTLLRLKIYRHVLVFSFLTTFLRSVFLFWTPKFLFDIGLGTSTAILQSAIFL